MAGVPAGVAFDPIFNAKAQKAALMMSANDDLSHSPPSTWRHYSTDGAEAAAKSDLILGYSGPRAISGYMEDFGVGNETVGHRRWLLFPQTRIMGTGDIPGDGSFPEANALWVITPEAAEPRPPVRDDFVAWPPPGFVPHTLVFPRWSFAFPGADFTGATVTMRRGNANVPVAIESRGAGAGENAIVWTWDNLDANAEFSPSTPPASDLPIQVVVSGVGIGGESRSFSYTVTLFDPQRRGADTVLATTTGSTQAVVGEGMVYSTNEVPEASGYQFRTVKVAALAAAEGAEGGLANVTTDPASGASWLSSTYRATGARSFHLTTPDFGKQSIALRRTVLVGAGGHLRFKSRFGFATNRQVARAQVSVDDGVTWETVWSGAGTGTPATGFSERAISLGSYVGRTIGVRFVFAYEGPGGAYPQTEENYGWYLDDVTFTNAEEVTEIAPGELGTALSHTFIPAAAGTHAVQARGAFFGDYLFEWGPALKVSVLPAGGVISPITRAAGRYRGLALSAPPAHDSCGLVSLTITPAAGFSGAVIIGGRRYGIRGVFDATGVARFGTEEELILPRVGREPLRLRLRLPTGSDSPARVLGEIQESGGFLAAIDAPRALYTASTNPIPPLVNPPGNLPGPYTGELVLESATPIPLMNGRGWVTLTVAKNGTSFFRGIAPDGTRWTSSQPIAVDGSVPIFAALYGAKGSLFGNVAVVGEPRTLAAQVHWFRPPNLAGTRFLEGWPAGVRLALSGERWTPFVVGTTWPLAGLSATQGGAHLWVNGGNLATPLDWAGAFTLSTGKAAMEAHPSGATATFSCSASTGVFTGVFKPSVDAKAVGFSGVLTPSANRARGYFLTPEGSGAVTLLPQ